MRTSIICRALAGVAALAAFLGCGNDDAPRCVAERACGGDLAGAWEVEQACVTAKLSIDGCGDLAVDAAGLDASGSYTFLPDRIFRSDLVLSGKAKLMVPVSCLANVPELRGTRITCEQLGAALTLLAASEGRSKSSVRCSGTDACSCELELRGESVASAGSYASNGARVSLTFAGATAAQAADYCVDGKSATLSSEMKVSGLSLVAAMRLKRRSTSASPAGAGGP